VSTEENKERKPLKMVQCGECGAKVFIPGDLEPLGTTPCSKCESPIMMPMMMRQFNLLRPIAEGGMDKNWVPTAPDWDIKSEKKSVLKSKRISKYVGCTGGVFKHKCIIQFTIIIFQQGPVHSHTNRHSSIPQSGPKEIMI